MHNAGPSGASRRRKATQADVARHAGVSPSVVSAVLNGQSTGAIRVSEATRERVRESIRELGYVPNVAARNLARGRNGIIGLFSYVPVFPADVGGFAYPFLAGVERAADEAGQHLLMFSTSRDVSGRRTIFPDGVNSLALADASIVLGPHEPREEIIRLAEEGYPFVVIGRRDYAGDEISSVAADYVQGTASVVEGLAARGHKRVCLLRSEREHESLADRREGFTLGCERSGLAPVVVVAPPPGELSTLVASLHSDAVTAVVAESAGLARGACTAAAHVGISIPKQLSVVGLSGAGTSASGDMSLATLVVPGEAMGAEAVRLVLDLSTQPGMRPRSAVLPCDVDWSGTVSVCPGATSP